MYFVYNQKRRRKKNSRSSSIEQIICKILKLDAWTNREEEGKRRRRGWKKLQRRCGRWKAGGEQKKLDRTAFERKGKNVYRAWATSVSGLTFYLDYQVRRNWRLLDSFPFLCLAVLSEIITLSVIDGRRADHSPLGRREGFLFNSSLSLPFSFPLVSAQDKIELSEMEIMRLRWNRIATDGIVSVTRACPHPGQILGKHCWWGWTMKWLAAVCP